MPSSIYLQLEMCSQNQRRNRNLPGQPPSDHKQLAICEQFSFIHFQSQYDTTPVFLLRTYLPDACMRRSGCFGGERSSWHLRVVSLHLLLDLYPLHSHCFVLIYPCERALRAEAARGAKRLVATPRNYLSAPKSVRRYNYRTVRTMIPLPGFVLLYNI